MAKRSDSTRNRVNKKLLSRAMCGDPAAIKELGALGPAVVPRLLTAFQGPYPPDNHPRDVWENLELALSLAVEQDAEPLLKILNGELPGDVGLAVCAIARSRDSRVSDALLAALNHSTRFVREHAATALIQRRETGALHALLPRICDRSTSVGSSIVFGILGASKFHDVCAIPYLERFIARKSVQRLPGLFDRTQRLLGKLKAKQQAEAPTRVDLSEERISVKRLQSISSLVNLEELSLSDAQITAGGLVYLGRMKKLRSLRLDGANIGDDGMEHLTKLRRLEVLRLRGCGLTDRAFLSLIKLKRLKYLDLSWNSLTDKGLEHSSSLANLKGIDLRGTQVTGRIIAALIKLDHLEELLASGTKFDQTARARLQRKLPRCRIDERPWQLSYRVGH